MRKYSSHLTLHQHNIRHLTVVHNIQEKIKRIKAKETMVSKRNEEQQLTKKWWWWETKSLLLKEKVKMYCFCSKLYTSLQIITTTAIIAAPPITRFYWVMIIIIPSICRIAVKRSIQNKWFNHPKSWAISLILAWNRRLMNTWSPINTSSTATASTIIHGAWHLDRSFRYTTKQLMSGLTS